MSDRDALLVIDMQMIFFDPDAGMVYDADKLIANVKRLIEQARQAAVPVIYVQHCGGEGHPLQRGLPIWQIHPAIGPTEMDTIVYKQHPDSFQDTDLHEQLTRLGVDKLVVTGIQTELCVDSTCRRAYSLGYDVTLVADGHSTEAVPPLSAAQVIAHHNAVLSNWFVRLKAADEVKFGAGALGSSSGGEG